MEIKGIIIKSLDMQSGVSKAKGTPWMSQTYIIETQESYPRKVAFEVFGEDKIKSMNIQPGEALTVSFDIDAREYQGRWYNTRRAWKIERENPENINGTTSNVSTLSPSITESQMGSFSIDPLPFDNPNDTIDFPF